MDGSGGPAFEQPLPGVLQGLLRRRAANLLVTLPAHTETGGHHQLQEICLTGAGVVWQAGTTEVTQCAATSGTGSCYASTLAHPMARQLSVEKGVLCTS